MVHTTRPRERKDSAQSSADEPRDIAASSSEQSSRKRKRGRQEPELRHVCQVAGCGKTYSRAEHLHRHQLNHNPKQIFRCSWPNCQRSFVRQDLCTRHEERHVARGASKRMQAHESDSFIVSSHSQDHDPNALNSSPQDSNSFQTPQAAHASGKSRRPTLRSGLSEGSGLDATSKSMMTSMPHHEDVGATSGLTNQAPHWQPTNIADGSNLAQKHLYRHDMSMHPNIPNTNLSPDWSDASAAPGFSGNGERFQGQTRQYSDDELGNKDYDPASTNPDTDLSRWTFPFPDETTAWLFGDANYLNDVVTEPTLFDTINGMNFGSNLDPSPPFLQDLRTPSDLTSPPLTQHSGSFPPGVDLEPVLPEAALSETKRQALITLIEQKFDLTDKSRGAKQKADFMQGDLANSSHILSLGMMVTYIYSYFRHFHPQVPMIHRPTFRPDKCPSLLLLSMMVIGAASLERIHGHAVTQLCAELATFLAINLRWQLFRDDAFQPPAKLWMFQALLLLEFYEKTFTTTRALHERAHVHHGTTLNLLRRGSFLVGSPAGDGEESDSQELHNQPSSSARNWWTAWVAKEATRRAVFTAFLLDTTHALMFGHTATLAVQELNLPLPVDEALWNNSSPNEVARQWSIVRKSYENCRLLDQLKQTLNGQPVECNTFGRTVLMVGLLSVGWHMSQRDIQVNSLGAATRDLGEEKWRTSLKRSFHSWKHDFDMDLSRHPSEQDSATQVRDGSVDVLYRLACMSLCADTVDLQIYAGSKVQLGRHVTQKDYETVKKRVVERWAPSGKAREATFHALKFLTKVLIGDDGAAAMFDYSAREDDLLNRPWLLFYSALTVWSYGFALDGPVASGSAISRSLKIRDMTLFLNRMAQVDTPDDLASMNDKSSCVGLLMTLSDLFKDTRWVLLHEASALLDNCIRQLLV